ncbi:MAG: DUF2894 domain-containing protein [Gammaproteobacteria bacterium]|nr:DUF2894 domain-containing protein [Gammaproteobacteria bacterium]MDH5172245.1 DUF2894 domain-containing protein [Gammaproteobacteria bacterium]
MSADTASRAAQLQAAVAALEAGGGDRFNPVRFRYIKAMAGRSLQPDGTVADLVAEKALAALRQYELELSRERAEAAALVEQLSAGQPAAGEALRALLGASDFRAVKRIAARPRPSGAAEALADLVRRLQQAQGHAEQDPAAAPAGELKAAGYFRDVLQQQRADKLVARAQLEAPADSGPLNPQKLVIRSLSAMREISPRYLARFVSYVDTLFWLEKAGENTRN